MKRKWHTISSRIEILCQWPSGQEQDDESAYPLWLMNESAWADQGIVYKLMMKKSGNLTVVIVTCHFHFSRLTLIVFMHELTPWLLPCGRKLPIFLSMYSDKVAKRDSNTSDSALEGNSNSLSISVSQSNFIKHVYMLLLFLKSKVWLVEVDLARSIDTEELNNVVGRQSMAQTTKNCYWMNINVRQIDKIRGICWNDWSSSLRDRRWVHYAMIPDLPKLTCISNIWADHRHHPQLILLWRPGNAILYALLYIGIVFPFFSNSLKSCISVIPRETISCFR